MILVLLIYFFYGRAGPFIIESLYFLLAGATESWTGLSWNSSRTLVHNFCMLLSFCESCGSNHQLERGFLNKSLTTFPNAFVFIMSKEAEKSAHQWSSLTMRLFVFVAWAQLPHTELTCWITADTQHRMYTFKSIFYFVAEMPMLHSSGCIQLNSFWLSLEIA